MFLVPIYPVILVTNFFRMLPMLLFGPTQRKWICARKFCTYKHVDSVRKQLNVFLDHVLVRSLPMQLPILKSRTCRMLPIAALKSACACSGQYDYMFKAIGLELKDRFKKKDFIHEEHWEVLKNTAEKELFMFETTVDALFTLLDLDESNSIDQEEFEFLMKVLLTEVIQEGSVYDTLVKESGLELSFTAALEEPRDEDEAKPT